MIQVTSERRDQVAHYLKGLKHISTGSCPGCTDCGLPSEPSTLECDLANEPSFSSMPCEICGSTLGGNRYPIHAVNPDSDTVVHLNGCVDCMYYIEYGQIEMNNPQPMGGLQ